MPSEQLPIRRERFLRLPAQRVSAIVLGVALALVVIDFIVYISSFYYSVSKYTFYYINCISGRDIRDVCADRQGYVRLLMVFAALGAAGLFWQQTYGRVFAAMLRIASWVRTGNANSN